jgi:hypothetical protein
MAMDPKPRRPGEGCIRHADGSITDADFWDDMLDNPEADRLSLLRSRARARLQGMSEADLDRYLPLSDETGAS